MVDDFNVICSYNESIGGNIRPLVAMSDFNDLDFCRVVDLCSQGHNMTWCNGQ